MLNDVIVIVCLFGVLRYGFISIPNPFFFGEISRHVFDKMSILNGRKGQSWLVLDSYETAVVSGFVASSKNAGSISEAHCFSYDFHFAVDSLHILAQYWAFIFLT